MDIRSSHGLRRILISVLIVLVAAQILVYILTTLRSIPLAFDGWCYVAAARSILSKTDMYARNLSGIIPEGLPIAKHVYLYDTPYIYPPLLAILILPLAPLHIQTAMLIWALFIIAINILLIHYLRPIVHQRIAWLLVFAFLPTWENWYNGQVSTLIALLFAVAITTVVAGRVRLSATALMVGALVKVTPIVGLATLAMYYPRRTVMVSVGVGGAIVLATLPIVGVDAWVRGTLIAFQVSRPASAPISLGPILAAMPGMLGRLAPVAVAVCLIIITMVRARAIAPSAAIAAVSLVPVFTAPIAWSHHLVIALPALAVLWSLGGRSAWLAALTWLAIGLVLTQPAAIVLLPLCWAALCWPQYLVPQPTA